MGKLDPLSACVDTGVIKLHYLEWLPEYVDLPSFSFLSPLSSLLQETDTLPIVLLHSLGTTADIWRLVARHTDYRHTLFAFDLRGHGASQQATEGYDMVSVSEDVVHGMAYLGLGQIALVGHGWGARVALVFAARHPALVSHLVLVDCPHVEPRHWPGMTRERFIREKTPPAMLRSRSDFLSVFRRTLASYWSPEIEEIVLKSVFENPDGTLSEILGPRQQESIRASFWDDRALSHYSKLACPVLLIPAAERPDASFPLPSRLQNQEEFAIAKGLMASQVERLIPDCTVLWMPNTIHDIQLQRPAELAQAIISFIRSH